MKSLNSILLACFIVAILPGSNVAAQTGNTSIAKWKDGKKGAFSLRFDDSMWSHHDHAIPNLAKRGLVGSFYINAGTGRFGYGIDSWESLVSRTGMEICPHSMNHTGAADFEEADYEAGESFRTVWRLNPPDKSKLYPFSHGGGTLWPSGYREAVLKQYPVADFSSDAIRYRETDNKKELIDFARQAMTDEAWHYVLTHGTGPNLEWLGFEVSNFEGLLDYLESVKDELWVGTIGNIHKYVTERKTANVKVMEAGKSLIRLGLTSEVNAELYDCPLTLTTEVPSEWKYCHVSQGLLQSIYPVESGKVMFGAIPNRGDIVLKSSAMDTTPPGKFEVRDGTADDIDMSPLTNSISTNWDMADDEESGIARYWYKIGTTPGGGEVLDWIDNGLERKITTSRTNFSLVRGEIYYITVKAVNGVGLSSESISDGFTVNVTPDFIAFKEDFDNGYFSQWNEKRSNIGSDKNRIFISDEAAHEGTFGIQCHLQEDQSGEPFIAKHDLKENEISFTRFFFKLSSEFSIPTDGGAVQLLELKDESGAFISGVYVGFTEGIGLNVYARFQDNAGYNTTVPELRESYPLAYIPVKSDNWHRIDLKTVAHDGKGGIEIWLDGVREACITNRFTAGKAVSSLYIGTLFVSEHVSGELFLDDITVSDSYLD
jgi:hypothetical protein